MDLANKALIRYKKQVGNSKGTPVYEIATTGGLYMVAKSDKGKVEILGTGPHRAISRYIAEKKDPDLEFDDLEKSDFVPFEIIKPLIPQYTMLTDLMRQRSK